MTSTDVRFSGDRVRDLMRDRHLRAEDLAAASGRTRRQLDNYLGGRSEPPFGVAVKIARRLRVSVLDLVDGLGGDGPRPA